MGQIFHASLNFKRFFQSHLSYLCHFSVLTHNMLEAFLFHLIYLTSVIRGDRLLNIHLFGFAHIFITLPIFLVKSYKVFLL